MKYSLELLINQIKQSEGLFATKYIYRHLAVLLSYLFANFGIHPNLITLLSFSLNILACLFLLSTDQFNPIIALNSFLLLAFAYVLDCCDGQVARATHQSSKLGVWLDHTFDCAKTILINFVFGWILIRNFAGSDSELILSYFACFINLFGQLTYFFGWNYKVLLFEDRLVDKTLSSRKISFLLRLPFNIVDYGVFILLTFLLVSIQDFMWVYLTYGIVCFLVYLAYLVLSAFSMNSRLSGDIENNA